MRDGNKQEARTGAGHAGCCQYLEVRRIAGKVNQQAKIELKIPSKQIKPGLVGFSFLAATLAGIVSAGEIWLSPSNSLSYLNSQSYSGTGTRTNPYYGDFDYIMGHFVQANSKVHLGSGVFWTKGVNGVNANEFIIPTGVMIEGAGEAFTTVRRATNFAPYVQTNVYVLVSTSSNAAVCNLTVDCNAFDFYSRRWSNSIGGIDLTASGETIEHVTEINGLGFQYSPEGFQLSVGNYGQSSNQVLFCTVSNFLGTYGDGIAPIGDCLIEGNQIYLPVQPAGMRLYPLFGINVVASSQGSLVIGNHVYGGGDGFHNDTGGDTNLVIADNVFENVCEAVALTGDSRPYDSIKISHNLMLMQTNYPIYQEQMFMVLIGTTRDGQTNRNLVVDGNIIRYYHDVPFASDGVQGAMYIYGSNDLHQLNQNISIINNQIDARMPVSFAGKISKLYARGNTPLNGTNFASNGNPSLTNVAGNQTITQQ